MREVIERPRRETGSDSTEEPRLIQHNGQWQVLDAAPQSLSLIVEPGRLELWWLGQCEHGWRS